MALVLVARQNGKTLLCRVLTLYWMFVELVPMVLGSSTSRDYAKQSWLEVIEMAENNETLALELGRKHTRLQVGEEVFSTLAGSHYKFGATNRRLGRSLTVHRNIFDELREHADFEAYKAAMYAMNAVRDAQAVAITNQGDARSVVLDELRESAITYLETGAGDPRLGIFEYSAPAGCDPTDLEALAQANPNLGTRIDPDAIIGDAIRAQMKGGETLTGFKTEVMCQRVMLLDPAIDPEKWHACGTDTPLDLALHRRQLALCLDVALLLAMRSISTQHVILLLCEI